MNVDEVEMIIKRVLDGETEAYAELVRAYQSDVWRVVVAMLRDARATEDLVQQAFVNAYFALERFDRGKDFGVWVKAIARNLVREDLRKRSREQRRVNLYWEQLQTDLADEPRRERQEAQMADALKKCREELPEHTAAVVALRYEEVMDYELIASRLGRTEEAVKQLLYRARLLLRDCIEKRLEKS